MVDEMGVDVIHATSVYLLNVDCVCYIEITEQLDSLLAIRQGARPHTPTKSLHLPTVPMQ